MNTTSRILGPNGKPLPRAPAVDRRAIRGKYDAAVQHSESRRHWAQADSLSARAANSLAVRQTLRNRARYESGNNSYCRGLVLTLANDLIGTGPRLRAKSGNKNKSLNEAVELAFDGWARAVDLAGKLQVLTQAKKVDGEAFLLLTDNPRVANPVKLDLQPVECDRISSLDSEPETPNEADGIRFDAFGNPTEYYLLDESPGDLGGEGWRRPQQRSDPGWYMIHPAGARFDQRAGRWLPARDVLHWFRADRPGQVRGVPEITPALPLFAQLRRYTLAVIAAAETSADFAVVIESTLEPETDEQGRAINTIDTKDMAEIEPRMMVALPAGYKANQMRAEQPATTYAMFKQEILSEIARALNVPSNLAAGNFNQASYASGRLDYQLYRMALRVEEAGLRQAVLERVFQSWLEEALLIPELLPRELGLVDVRAGWLFDGWEHVNPTKEAEANEINLRNRTVSRTEICADKGRDWDEVEQELEQEELRLAKRPSAPAGQEKPPPEEEDAEEAEEDADA